MRFIAQIKSKWFIKRRRKQNPSAKMPGVGKTFGFSMGDMCQMYG